MSSGVVKFFNDAKGFGFIIDSETGKDIFVHSSGLLEPIKEKDNVEFSVEKGKKGLQAENVKKV